VARSYGAGKFARAGGSEGGAVAVQGFDQLQRALRRIEDGTAPELKQRMKLIGEHVREVARGNITHKTGRHDPHVPRLEDSLKVSVTMRGASIYSTSEAGGAQNVGGRVGRNHATILKRADASHYMDNAVKSETAYVQKEVNEVINWLLVEFQK
jgi:hypothetical protein